MFWGSCSWLSEDKEEDGRDSELMKRGMYFFLPSPRGILGRYYKYRVFSQKVLEKLRSICFFSERNGEVKNVIRGGWKTFL